jgi:two-component system sensor histidine kinase KdpD
LASCNRPALSQNGLARADQFLPLGLCSSEVGRGVAPEQKRALEENLRFADDIGADVIRVQRSDVARALMEVAHGKNVGSIVIGHSRHGRLHELVRRSVVHKLMRLAGDVDVHVVSDRERVRGHPH